MNWINSKNKKPNHGQVVIVHVGYANPDPINSKVAEYDSKEDCYVFGKADGDFPYYCTCGFVRSEIVTGWIPFPVVF